MTTIRLRTMFLLLTCLLLSGLNIGCKTTDEGTVNVVTSTGAIENIWKPQDGFYTTLSLWRSSYEVSLRTFTEKVENVKVQSKDNTPIILGTLMITAHTDGVDEAIKAYVRKFGFDEEQRHKARLQILESQLQTEARKAFSVYDAYTVYANQDKIQTDLFDRMKKIGKDELFLVVESVQFGNWHFEDKRVEDAASAVVANQKQREAEQALLEAAKIKQQTQQLQAQVYSDPRMFELERLRVLKDIEAYRSTGISGHNGPLTLIYGSGSAPGLQLQIPGGQGKEK